MKIYNGYLNNLRESYFVCIFATLKVEKNASVAELVDALDSKSCSERSARSSRAWGTTYFLNILVCAIPKWETNAFSSSEL